MKLVLIRTGESEYDDQGRIQGTLDVPLSAGGRRQVEQAAKQIRAAGIAPDALYSGPCRSVEQSAEQVGKTLDLKPKTLDSLANINHGLWQGMLVEEVKVNQPKVYKKWRETPDSVCPPEGEPLQHVRERLRKALVKLRKKHKKGTVALVMPRPVACVMRSLLGDVAVGDLWDVTSNGSSLWELVTAPDAPIK